MSVVGVDPGRLLAELTALPVEQRLAHLRAAGPPETLLPALGDEAEQLAAVEVTQALVASEAVVALADDIDAPLARANARGARAMVLAYAGRFADALAVCEEAIAIAEADGLVVEAARVRLASVHPLANLARYDEALAAGEAARTALVAAGELTLAARADVSLGATYDMRDDPAGALRHYDRARPALADDPTALAQLDTNRGISLMGLDDFAGAETAFRAAVAAFEAGGLTWATAIAEANLAYLATRQGRLERALRHFERARRCLEADDAPANLARLLAEQADAFAILGLPAEALAAYEQVVPELDRHGLAAEAAQARAGLGRALLRVGRLAEAECALTAAAAAFDALDLVVPRARVDLTRVELAAARGHRDEARALVDDALTTLAERPAEAVLAREQAARLALADDDLSTAEAELDAAFPTAEELDLAPVLADLLHLRGLAHRARGDADRALADLQAAIVQIERVRGTLQAERFRTAFLGNRLTVYEDAVVAALDRGGPAAAAAAFAVVERAKGRALLDLVGGALDLAEAAERPTTDPAEAALLAELGRLRAEMNWFYSQVGGEGVAGRGADGGWHRAVQRREAELDALQGRVSAARGVAGLYAPPLDLAGALRLIPADAALVEYFVAGGELLAFVLRDGRATVVRRLAGLDDLADRVRRVRFQLGRALIGGERVREGRRAERLLGDVRRELAALDAAVLGPLRAALEGARRLVIVPHGPLHALPFHALWDGERYLIERCEVVFAPSASLLAHLPSPRARTGPPVALVVGVPDAVAPRIGAEAERVAATLGADRLLLGPDATADRVTTAAQDADVVHLACHGRFAAESPLSSGLRLADRWLTVRDVYALRLRATLVTLSGCETGRSAVGGGDELVGLMRGFFAAGASSLMISLWTVNDASTADLMASFYETWQRGATTPAALRFAQRSLLEHQPHPAFWAPFILGGTP